LPRDPILVRNQDLRDRNPLPARHQRHPRPQAGDAPARDRRPVASRRAPRPRPAAGSRSRGRGGGRDHRRGASTAGGGALRRTAADPRRGVPGVRGRDPCARVPDGPRHRVKLEPAAHLTGHVAVPGDKSISHRAVLLGAIGEGETRVRGFGRSADTEASVAAARALGVNVEEIAHDELHIHGAGLRGLRAGTVDCANAGTLMRLLAGIVAGQPGRFELTGDESLSSRPMERIAESLRRMGANVVTTEGHAPLAIEGVDSLRGLTYELPVASAQVKSAVLLAGINATGQTTVVEPAPTRDHTELMLESAGVPVRRGPTSITVQPAGSLRLG